MIEVCADALTFQRTGQIKNFLLQHTPQESIAFVQIQNDKSFSSNFNKVLRPLTKRFGVVVKDTRSNYKGWAVRFLFDF